jgi:hypothetical protein
MCGYINVIWGKERSPEVNLSLYRLERPLGLQDFEAPRIARKSVHEGGKVVSPKHRPPLTPGDIAGTHFCLRPSRPIGKN